MDNISELSHLFVTSGSILTHCPDTMPYELDGNNFAASGTYVAPDPNKGCPVELVAFAPGAHSTNFFPDR